MKFIFSIFMLLSFLCFRAQKQDSLNNDKIVEIVLLGRQKQDCQKIYNEEKALYKKQLAELKKVNFQKLYDEVLKLKEFEKIKYDERRIIIFNLDYTIINSICGNDSYFDCKHYEKNIQSDVFEKLWKKNNYLKIQKFFDNKIIIPLVGLPFSSLEQNMNDKNSYLKKQNIKPLYKGIYRDLNNKKKEFHYSSYKKITENLEINLDKNKTISENHLQLDMKIVPVVSKKSSVYSVAIILGDGEKELSKKYLHYQYKNGKWNFLDEKN